MIDPIAFQAYLRRLSAPRTMPAPSRAQAPLSAEAPLPAVNVSTVQHISPFRYPGGKTWLVPTVLRWLRHRQPAEFIELFAGGASVGLAVAAAQSAPLVRLVELDPDVAAVWTVLITRGQGAALARMIRDFDLTPETAKEVLMKERPGLVHRAFRTLLRNRLNRGGVLAKGAGWVKRGENGKGLRQRWYPETLCRRLAQIHQLRGRLCFVQGDGLQVLEANLDRKDVVFFADPPYTAGGKRAGRRLYDHADIDHARLFALAARARGALLMTYDDNEEALRLARKSGMRHRRVAMKSGHHGQQTELVLSRDLRGV